MNKCDKRRRETHFRRQQSINQTVSLPPMRPNRKWIDCIHAEGGRRERWKRLHHGTTGRLCRKTPSAEKVPVAMYSSAAIGDGDSSVFFSRTFEIIGLLVVWGGEGGGKNGAERVEGCNQERQRSIILFRLVDLLSFALSLATCQILCVWRGSN